MSCNNTYDVINTWYTIHMSQYLICCNNTYVTITNLEQTSARP